MDVAERGVTHAALRELLLRHRAIWRVGTAQLGVKHEKLCYAILRRGTKAAQKSLTRGRRISRSPDAHAKLGQENTLQSRRAEDVDVIRKRQMRIQRAPGVPVMVSRRDEYGHAHLSERSKQRLAGLGVGAAAVQKVSGEKQEIGISLVYLRRNALQ